MARKALLIKVPKPRRRLARGTVQRVHKDRKKYSRREKHGGKAEEAPLNEES